MNLVIPIGSASKFFPVDEYFYPKSLIEIDGKPMIQHVIENLTSDIRFKKIIVVLRSEDCVKFHLDDTLELLCPDNIILKIIKIHGNTQGALCSILLAIDEINEDENLVIANSDQIFTSGIGNKILEFKNSKFDAACITFDSVHPRWSYVKVDPNGFVVETAEKKPLSRFAIAGLYMYRSGKDFVKYGMNVIRHSANTDDVYYISSVFNEYILGDKKVRHFLVENNLFHTFYNPQKVKEYEASLRNKNEII